MKSNLLFCVGLIVEAHFGGAARVESRFNWLNHIPFALAEVDVPASAVRSSSCRYALLDSPWDSGTSRAKRPGRGCERLCDASYIWLFVWGRWQPGVMVPGSSFRNESGEAAMVVNPNRLPRGPSLLFVAGAGRGPPGAGPQGNSFRVHYATHQ